MRALTYLIIFLFYFEKSHSQEVYQIKGTIKNYGLGDRIYLFKQSLFEHEKFELQDSTDLQDSHGNFSFKGTYLSSDTEMQPVLVLERNGNDKSHPVHPTYAKERLQFYFDTVTLDFGEIADIDNAKIPASRLNSLFLEIAAIAKEMAKSNNRLYKLRSDFLIRNDGILAKAETHDRLQKALELTTQSLMISKKLFISLYPDLLPSLHFVKQMTKARTDPKIALAMLEDLGDSVKALPEAESFRNSQLELLSVAIGAKAPEFSQPDMKGKMVHLSDYKGKYVLLEFYLVQCPPCRVMEHFYKDIYKKYRQQNFEMIGISLDREKDRDQLLKLIRREKLEWPQTADFLGSKSTAALAYHVSEVPRNFLISPEGKIIAKDLNGLQLHEKMKELFGY